MGVPYRAVGGLPLDLVALPLELEDPLKKGAYPWKQGAFQVEEASCQAAPYC